MSEPSNEKDIKFMEFLSDLIADSSNQSIEEVHEDLKQMGINGHDFTAQVKEMVAQAVERERVSWIPKAQKEMVQSSIQIIVNKEVPADRASILSKVKDKIDELVNAGFEVPQATFHKLEDASDEDILSILEDLECLESMSKKKDPSEK